MTAHICNLLHDETWERIREYISGRQKKTSDSFMCGACCKSFETICYLHLHCMTHTSGGSYYFDHVTSTAFPRFGSTCRSTQLDDGDQIQTILETDKIIQCTAGSINLINPPSCSQTEDGAGSRSMNTSVETVPEKKAVSVIKVRNVKKSRDGSIVFEMDEEYAHLSDTTAQKVVEEMNKLGDQVFETASELEVCVSLPTEGCDHPLLEHSVKSSKVDQQREEISSARTSNSSSGTLKQSTELELCAQNPPNSCVGVSKQLTFQEISTQNAVNSSTNVSKQSIVHETSTQNSATFSAVPLKESTVLSLSTQNAIYSSSNASKQSNEQYNNDVEDSLFKNHNDNKETSENSSNNTSELIDIKLDDVKSGAEENPCSMDTSGKVEIDRNIDKDSVFIDGHHNESIGEKFEQCVERTLPSSKMNVSQKILPNNTDILPTVRSTRKRTLTPKMKESILAKSLFLNLEDAQPKDKRTRTEARHCEKKKQYTSKDGDSNSKPLDDDIYASEVLLSLRENNSASSKKLLGTSKSKSGNNRTNLHGENSKTQDAKTNINDKTGSAITEMSKDVSGDKRNQCMIINAVTGVVEYVDDDNDDDNDNISGDNLTNADQNLIQGELRMKADELKTNSKISAETNCDNENDDGGDDDVENLMTDNDVHDNDFVPKMPRNRLSESAKIKEKELMCPTCGKVGTAAMIKYHEQMHSKAKFDCKECGKSLKTEACLKSHMRTHGEKKWKCDLCSAAFFRKSYLTSHKTNHTGDYPYQCEICGLKFKMSYILRRHVNSVHKNVRPYKCDICHKEFFRLSTRDNHRVRHFDASLKCSHCPKMFKADLDLRKHELTHSGEKLLFCPKCHCGFSQLWPYYKHMWNTHHVDREEAKKIRIMNPDIKNMRIVKHKSEPDDATFIKTTLPSLPSSLNKTVKLTDQNMFTSVMNGSNFGSDRSEITGTVYSRSGGDFTDTVVLDIDESLDVNSTIVIQSEDIQAVDSGSYIVVDDRQGDSNIVVFSELNDTEIEQIVSDCSVAGTNFSKVLH